MENLLQGMTNIFAGSILGPHTENLVIGLNNIMAGSKFGQHIIGLIIFLFILSCGILLINMTRIFKEKKALSKAKAKFQEAVDVQQSVSQLVENILKELPISLVSRRIDTLFRIRQIHSISTDLLEKMDMMEEGRRYGFIRFVISILLILGLLGTVFGLSIAVQNIVPAIQDAQNLADVKTLANALTKTMGGLYTAFNTTLVGLGCTFLLSMFVFIVQRQERRFLFELEYFTTYELMPYILISDEAEANTLYVEAVERSANDIAQAAEVLDKSREGIESIVSGLVRATNTSETRMVDFFNFANSFQDSVAQLMGYKDDIQVTYDRIEDVLKKIKDNQLSDKMIGEIVDKSVARSMAATQEATETVRETFRNDIQKIEQGQKEYIEGVQNTAKAIENLSKNNAEEFTGVVSDAFDKSISTFQDELKNLTKREDISRMIAMDTVEEFKKFISDSVEMNKKSHSTMKHVLQSLDKLNSSKGKKSKISATQITAE